MQQITNRTFEEIQVGETLSVSRKLTQTEVEALALVSGDLDPFHVGATQGDGEERPKRDGNGAAPSAT